MMVVRLMDLGRVCYGILDLCFEGVSFLSVSGDLRANAGIGRKVPFEIYNLTNISRAGLASGRSLVEQMALLLLLTM